MFETKMCQYCGEEISVKHPASHLCMKREYTNKELLQFPADMRFRYLEAQAIQFNKENPNYAEEVTSGS